MILLGRHPCVAMSIENLDPAIVAAFPTGSRILSIVQHGDTNWSTGFKVDVEVDGKEERYFLKMIAREDLVGMAEAEYEGQKAISAVIPDNALEPIAWGYFDGDETKSWFLTHFRDLRARTPLLPPLVSIVKKLHQESVSPTGKFGFHVTPFYGPPPMIVDWTDNWEEFWTREFQSGLKYVQKMLGDDPELVEVAEQFICTVVPRLLRPLQAGGRNIKPSLCHGDLWDGNIQIDAETQQPVLFDPCPFYGHNEMDLQCMRSDRYAIGLDFVDLYKREVGASKPQEDFDDRNALYAIRNDIMTAGMCPQWSSLIEKAKEEMRRLINKHPEGLGGFKGDMTPNEAWEMETGNEGPSKLRDEILGEGPPLKCQLQ
ncbi:hypothetical protein QBC33DRAFT_548568 [Phialemonium atrogriseum]|uniref:protein-ribulosamine 3-kinase n=1 Tax=Phialemonium atrogriseum TaxID=1093897 RepID=A0AAJ0FI52_9PEZI|nr:uncharacterized protein QBC33DRAFT_548568 [Phialemonium atrogriseum]KAK1764023.1 hypothetical protein QBC33DRAFT_548568 [Phialemonium atrogriseum]